jgi:hypothetical protein
MWVFEQKFDGRLSKATVGVAAFTKQCPGSSAKVRLKIPNKPFVVPQPSGPLLEGCFINWHDLSYL